MLDPANGVAKREGACLSHALFQCCHHCTVITDLDTSKRSTQKTISCCDAILETGPAVSMRSELLVVHEKLGQLPVLTVYVVPVKGEK
jgi:hypothetical protein